MMVPRTLRVRYGTIRYKQKEGSGPGEFSRIKKKRKVKTGKVCLVPRGKQESLEVPQAREKVKVEGLNGLLMD